MADDKDNPGFNPDAPKEDEPQLGPTDPTAGLAAEFGAMEDENDGGIPAVAESNTKNMAIVGFGIVMVLFLVYQLLSGEEEPVRTPIQGGGSSNAGEDIVQVKEKRVSQRDFAPIPPPPPEAPPEPAAPPPPPPAPPISSSLPPPIDFEDEFGGGGGSRQSSLAFRERITSPMIISGGGGIGDAIGQALEGGAGVARKTEKLDETTAPQVDATQSGSPFHSIYQGKLIDAVLESAINTELPGTIRAVVSRDVYAEAGRDVMIPKGSRLIGSYDAEVVRGQGRVFMVWDRVVRPDGVDVALRSPVADNLGRAGVPGEVDNRFVEILSNSLLTSAITIGVAQLSETVTGAEGTTTNETNSGNVLTTGDLVSTASVDAIDDFGSNMDSFLDGFLDGRPIITIPQGQSVKVFVNRDLIFPKSSARSVRIIQ